MCVCFYCSSDCPSQVLVFGQVLVFRKLWTPLFYTSHYGLTICYSCFDDKVFKFWTQIPTYLVQADIHISFRPSKTSQSSLQIDSHGIFYTAHLSHIWDVGLCVLISHKPLISNMSGQLDMKRGKREAERKRKEEGRWKEGGGWKKEGGGGWKEEEGGWWQELMITSWWFISSWWWLVQKELLSLLVRCMSCRTTSATLSGPHRCIPNWSE